MTAERTYTEAVSEFGEGMARLEGKLDTGMAKLEGALNTLTQAVESGNAARVAEAANLRKDVDDHETRIRTLEDRRTITPLGLWSVVLGAIAAVAAIAGIINAFSA